MHVLHALVFRSFYHTFQSALRPLHKQTLKLQQTVSGLHLRKHLMHTYFCRRRNICMTSDFCTDWPVRIRWNIGISESVFSSVQRCPWQLLETTGYAGRCESAINPVSPVRSICTSMHYPGRPTYMYWHRCFKWNNYTRPNCEAENNKNG